MTAGSPASAARPVKVAKPGWRPTSGVAMPKPSLTLWIVDGEADHEKGSKRGFAGSDGGTDGEPFAEIVKADAECHEGRELQTLRRTMPAA
jgi:hypothetical protein